MKYILTLAVAIGLLVSTAEAKTLDAAISQVTTSGSVGSNARRIVFIFSSDFVGTVAGGPFTGATDASLELNAGTNDINDVLGPVAYTVSAGSMRIIRIQ
jgi:hypothetical protein